MSCGKFNITRSVVVIFSPRSPPAIRAYDEGGYRRIQCVRIVKAHPRVHCAASNVFAVKSAGLDLKLLGIYSTRLSPFVLKEKGMPVLDSFAGVGIAEDSLTGDDSYAV